MIMRAVFPGGDHVQRGWDGSLRSGDEKVLESGSRRRDGNSFEERASFHGGSLKCGKDKPAKNSGGSGARQEILRTGGERFLDPSEC
jgi:hypothetical protein